MKKMNNKGFSLVELIVVVLIMAIIAVALAPQVMKWVENSRKSTDCNNYDSVVSAVNIALADEAVMAEVAAGDVTLQWAQNSAWSGAGTQLTAGIKRVLGDDFDDMRIKRTTDLAGVPYTITVKANGTVERTSAPTSNSVS
ncbi:MAG: type II secretion system GspH family protein [Lachnospiraceae bacterium]|nr:type II secretion system GspH family protein [Lachnospiraceae bacterium]